jgi:probable rRNA maturation factor
MPSKKKNAFPSPVFSVTYNAEFGSPKKPNATDIQQAFTRAWELVPLKQRPELHPDHLKRIAVDIIVVNDKRIARLNAAHLKHKGPTDVLSFPLGEFDPERCVFNLGEIVVSYETAQHEALARNLPYEEEMLRYCIHGFLHLIGYDDSTKTQREEMFKVQEKAVEGK